MVLSIRVGSQRGIRRSSPASYQSGSVDFSKRLFEIVRISQEFQKMDGIMVRRTRVVADWRSESRLGAHT